MDHLSKKQVENPKWREYVNTYNCCYHDEHMSDEQIVARLGPEPERYIFIDVDKNEQGERHE